MDKESLVSQIKQLQRTDDDVKQMWWNYCDEHLDGVKDPNRHDETVLQAFLDGYENGTLSSAAPKAPVAKGAKGGGKGWGTNGKGGGMIGKGWDSGMDTGMAAMMKGMFGGFGWGAGGMGMSGGKGNNAALVEFVKTGQRVSQNWKDAWHAYCNLYGDGKFNPAGHEESYITGFIDFLAGLGVESMGSAATVTPASTITPTPTGVKRGVPAAFAAPVAKRPAWGNGEDKMELVNKIKQLQRSDQSAKEAWWSFCDNNGGGVRDPSRHDAETLQQFLTEQGA